MNQKDQTNRAKVEIIFCRWVSLFGSFYKNILFKFIYTFSNSRLVMLLKSVFVSVFVQILSATYNLYKLKELYDVKKIENFVMNDLVSEEKIHEDE